MTELSSVAYGDPLTAPFWEAAVRRELVLQRCCACRAWQFNPRPFCLRCDGDELEWAAAAGSSTVYSLTTVRLQVTPDLEPPYAVAIVELDEGPRLLANIVSGACAIGDRVAVAWRPRDGGSALPVFPACEGGRR